MTIFLFDFIRVDIWVKKFFVNLCIDPKNHNFWIIQNIKIKKYKEFKKIFYSKHRYYDELGMYDKERQKKDMDKLQDSVKNR